MGTMSFIPFLQAAGTAGSASTTGALTGTLLPFLLIIIIFYFFLIRPQNKKQKETAVCRAGRGNRQYSRRRYRARPRTDFARRAAPADK